MGVNYCRRHSVGEAGAVELWIMFIIEAQVEELFEG